jgi:hypothetical protein
MPQRILAAEDSCRRSHVACQHQAPNSTASTVIKHRGSLKSDTQAALQALQQTRFARPHHLAQLLLGSLGRDFLLWDGRVSKLGRLEGAEVCHGRDSEDGLEARRRVDASWCDDHDTLAGLAVTDAEQSPGCFTLGALNLSAQFKQVRQTYRFGIHHRLLGGALVSGRDVLVVSVCAFGSRTCANLQGLVAISPAAAHVLDSPELLERHQVLATVSVHVNAEELSSQPWRLSNGADLPPRHSGAP